MPLGAVFGNQSVFEMYKMSTRSGDSFDVMLRCKPFVPVLNLPPTPLYPSPTSSPPSLLGMLMVAAQFLGHCTILKCSLPIDQCYFPAIQLLLFALPLYVPNCEFPPWEEVEEGF